MTHAVHRIVAAVIMSAAIVGPASANTQFRFPPKGAPYAVPHEHEKRVPAIKAATRLGKHHSWHRMTVRPWDGRSGLHKAQ